MTDTDGREYGIPGTRFTISPTAITIKKAGLLSSKKTIIPMRNVASW